MEEQKLTLEEIMKGNVARSQARSQREHLTVYINSSTIRFNKKMRDDLGDPKRIAFFIVGKHAFFIAEPEKKGLEEFEPRVNKAESSIASSALVLKLMSAFGVVKGKAPSFRLNYKSHSTNQYGIIFKLCLDESCGKLENKVNIKKKEDTSET